MILTAVLGLSLLGQVALPGRVEISLKEAAERAEFIVVAELVEVGFCQTSRNISSVNGMELKPSATLKGKPSAENLKELSCHTSEPDLWPLKGQQYIFFIEKRGKSFRIHDILPKTDKDIEAVKREIKAR